MKVKTLLDNPIVAKYLKRRNGRAGNDSSTKSLGGTYKRETASTVDTDPTKQSPNFPTARADKNVLQDLRKSSFTSQSKVEQKNKEEIKKVQKKYELKGKSSFSLQFWFALNFTQLF